MAEGKFRIEVNLSTPKSVELAFGWKVVCLAQRR